MLGPSQSALINVGARYPPCMKEIEGLTATTQFACMYSRYPPLVNCANPLQASTTQRTLQIDYARWKTYVGMVDSTTRLQINGSGTSMSFTYNYMLNLCVDS